MSLEKELEKRDRMLAEKSARIRELEAQLAERTCKLEPLEAFYVTVNMLDQTEWGVCSNCGTASPIDATYCCECGARVTPKNSETTPKVVSE